MLEVELREASEQYEEFAEVFSQDIGPTDTKLIRITKVSSIRIQTTKLAHDIVDVLDTASTE